LARPCFMRSNKFIFYPCVGFETCFETSAFLSIPSLYQSIPMLALSLR
jgi:hypothetical protein